LVSQPSVRGGFDLRSLMLDDSRQWLSSVRFPGPFLHLNWSNFHPLKRPNSCRTQCWWAYRQWPRRPPAVYGAGLPSKERRTSSPQGAPSALN